jgi:hypothetical protein
MSLFSVGQLQLFVIGNSPVIYISACSILSNFSVFFIIEMKKPLPVLRRVVRYEIMTDEIMTDRNLHNIRSLAMRKCYSFLKKF